MDVKQYTPNWKKQENFFRFLIALILIVGSGLLVARKFENPVVEKPNQLSPPVQEVTESIPEDLPIEAAPPSEMNEAGPTEETMNPEVSSPTSTEIPEENIKALQLMPSEIQTVRTQMKIALASVFTASSDFRSEHHRFTTDFLAMKWQPPARVLNFKIGFAKPFSPQSLIQNENPVLNSSDVFLTDQTQDRFEYSDLASGVLISKIASFCKQGCTANDSSFEVIGAMNLDGDEDLDIWIANHAREIIHVKDDLK